MATRSRIAIENQDGTVTSVYCHHDGYIDYNGVVLQKHYSQREKVEALIALGDLSSIGERVSTEESHSFENPSRGVTVAYHRDRSEDLNQETHESKEAFFTSDYEEYGYLFTKENKWLLIGNSGDEVQELEELF